MDPKLLKCVPTRYLCPYCGEWHKWENYELGYYDSTSYIAKLGCENQRSGYNHREMQVYFSDGYCYYRTIPTCVQGNLDIDNKIHIEDIVESSEEPRVTFSVPFTTKYDVGSRSKCDTCDCKNICLMYKLGDENNSRHMNITLGFEFKQSDYEKFSQVKALEREKKELQEREQAISSKEQDYKQPQATKIKEDTAMSNNIFNMNLEFGPNKDNNIASTLMGVAVKNGDSWRIYDKKKKEITDVGDMQLGNLPIFILPTTKLSEGDLIKDAGEYYFVIKVQAGSTQTLCAKTGEMKNVVPIKNILGFSCYSKVIALSDSLNIGDDFDIEKLAIMSAMFGQTGENGGQMNQMLPLMLFKDKLGEGDDTMKLMLMSSMMNPTADGGQMNQLLPLLIFKDKLGEGDDTMKLMLMSSMMDGNMEGSNNPLMSYLMLDAFIGKKDNNTPQTGVATK